MKIFAYPTTWQRFVANAVIYGFLISAIPVGMRALALQSYGALFDAGALGVWGMFSVMAAVGQLIFMASETRPWVRHWVFGVVIAYFAMALWISIFGYADFADMEVKWRMWAMAVPLGALCILAMRAWSRRKG